MLTYEEMVARNNKLRNKRSIIFSKPIVYGVIGAALGALASLSLLPIKKEQVSQTEKPAQTYVFENYNSKVGHYRFARVGTTTKEYFESFPEKIDINRNFVADKIVINPLGEVYAADKFKSTLIGFVDGKIIFPSEEVRARFSRNGQLEALLVKTDNDSYVEYRSRLGSA